MVEGGLVAERFRVGELVGAGGSGRVHRARDERTGELVALKILSGDQHEVADRLAREVQVLALLDHPGIVRYVDHGPLGADDYFLVMEWLEGEDLSKRLAREPLGLAATLELGERLADALAHAHARQIVHRDIKPANIFLGPAGTASTKLVDFGIAKPIDRRRARGTRPAGGNPTVTGVPIGTIGYMAPEQARGERLVDARADVFALGCVMYECIADRPAYTGDHALAVLAKILLESPARVSLVAKMPVPAWLDDLLSSMLALDPNARPADASAVARTLRTHARASRDALAATLPATRLLTTLERRLATAVASRPRLEVPEAALNAVARGHGVVLESMVDGTWVTVMQAAADATETVSRAAHLALALRPFGPVAMATSFAEAGYRRTGSALDGVFRLLDEAPEAEATVTVDELTGGLLDGAFEVARESPETRGGRLAAGTLVAPRRDRDPRRLLLGKVTPFVGRDKELAILDSTLSATIAEPAASAVVVLGPPGAGKSRLRHELVTSACRRYPDLRVFMVRAEPSRQATALGVVGALVAAEAGLRDDDESATRRARVRERLQTSVPDAELDRVCEFLGELAGVPAENPSLLLQGAKGDPRRMWRETAHALDEWIGGELRLGPVLVVLEDLQWIDAQSLNLFAELLTRSDRPLLLMAVGRPAARAMLADAEWQARALQVLQLPPLGRRASERLVRDALGEAVSDARVEAILARGEGHAFFLEELVRAEAEGRGSSGPATVVAMLQERIERFESDPRRILRAASIFGLEFTRGGIHALLVSEDGPEKWLDPWLETLIQREVIARAERHRFSNDPTFSFRHDLVHESIYATLTDEDRQRGHLLAARWLEANHERDAAVLGSHFERGGDSRSAATAFALAAEGAYKRGDAEVAGGLCERSVANGASEATLGRVRWVQAATALASRSMDDAARFGLEALELLPERNQYWFHAATVMVAVAAFGRPDLLGGLVAQVQQAGVPPDAELGTACLRTWALCSNMLYFAGLYELAGQFDERIEASAPTAVANESAAEAWLHFARHVRAGYCGGDPELTLDEAEKADAILEKTSDEILVWVRIEEAKAAALIGDFERAVRLLTWAIDVAGTENVWAAGLARHRLARVQLFLGKLDEARRLEQEAIKLFYDITMPIMSAIGDNHLAMIELAAGNLGAAKDALERAHGLLFAAPPVRTFALANQAFIALADGDPTAARAALEEAELAIPASGLINDGESAYDLAWIETCLALADREGARQRAQRGAARLRDRASRITRAEYRESFLSRVPENATILEHAEALQT
jgi:eukaryotic-like serine/threonine-protein kinase